MSSRDKWKISWKNVKAGKSCGIKIIIGLSACMFLIFALVILVDFYSDYMLDFSNSHSNKLYLFSPIQSVDFGDFRKEAEEKSLWSNACNADRCSVMADIRPVQSDGLKVKNTSVTINSKTYSGKKYNTEQRSYYRNINSGTALISLALFTDKKDWLGNQTEQLIAGAWPAEPGQILVDDYFLEVFGIPVSDAVGAQISILNDMDEEPLLNNYILSGVVSVDLIRKREDADYDMEDYHCEHIFINLRESDTDRFVICGGSVRYYYDKIEILTGEYTFSGDFTTKNTLKVDGKEETIYLSEKGLSLCLISFFTGKLGRIFAILCIGICLIIFLSLLYVLWFYLQRNKRYMSMLENIGLNRYDRKRLRMIELTILFLCSAMISAYLDLILFILFRYVSSRVLQFTCLNHPFHFCMIFIAGALVFYSLSFFMIQKYDRAEISR